MFLKVIIVGTTLCLLTVGASSALAADPSSQPVAIEAAPNAARTAAVEGEAIRRGTKSSDSGRRNAAGRDASTALTSPSTGVDVQRVLLSLSIVIGLIFVARWAMKRLFPGVAVGRNSQVIRVISRSVVGPKQQFLLIQLGKRLVLVGDSGASMHALAQIDDADEVASLVGQLQSESTASSMSAFSSLFRKAGSEFERGSDEALSRRGETSPSEDVEPSTDDDAKRDDVPARELVAAAGEISGLMDRVRTLSTRLRQS